MILNTVAGVILFFTNAFVQPGGVTRNILSNGYVFAAGGLCLGAISIFWTWGCVGMYVSPWTSSQAVVLGTVVVNTKLT